MTLSKTEQGRSALQSHSAGLSLSERRVLILCDGRRSRDELVSMFGPGTADALDRLLRDGYLAADGAAARDLATASSYAPSAPSDTAARRSLAASKMYLLDMLQLQRDAASASLRAEIQTSAGEDELAHRLLRGLHHLQAIAASGYAQRVGERLAEILPDAYLSKLQEVRGLQPLSTA